MPDTSAQAGWLRSLGEQAESSVPAPAEEGTRWASGKTQAPPSSPSFADPLSWHTQSACPGRGCCCTAGLSLLPSPCPPVLAPAHDTPLCAQAQGRALAAACKANFCTPASSGHCCKAIPREQGEGTNASPISPEQGAGGSSGLLLLSQTVGKKKAKAACGVSQEDETSRRARASQAGARCLPWAGLAPQGATGMLLRRENTTEHNSQSGDSTTLMEGPHSQEWQWEGSALEQFPV